MQWHHITIRTTTLGAEIVTGLLIDLDIQGAVIEDRADVAINQRPEGQWDILDEAIARNMDEDVKVNAYFADDEFAEGTLQSVRDMLDALRGEDLGFDVGKLTLEIASVDEEDWADNWKSEFHPFRLGEHFVIVPSWCEYESEPGDRILSIDPGMAFGTGTHETTALCVELVEVFIKPGDRVIDVGTGSGILALAAAAMGAKDVLAIDIDSVAVRVARENIERGGMGGVIRVAHGNLLDSTDEVADVVIANIIADVIIGFAEPVRAHIAPGGLFICSGIAINRLDDVLHALAAAGYGQPDARVMGEWAAVAVRR